MPRDKAFSLTYRGTGTPTGSQGLGGKYQITTDLRVPVPKDRLEAEAHNANQYPQLQDFDFKMFSVGNMPTQI